MRLRPDSDASNYNYFRDYDPSIGRYVESDPIGLSGGNNTYSYAIAAPLSLADVLGLDISITYFPGRAGHLGIGVSPGHTFGFYPDKNANAFSVVTCQDVAGGVHDDHERQDQKSINKSSTLTIKTLPEQDARLRHFVDQWRSTKGLEYNLCFQQCTRFVLNALAAAGIAAPGNGFTAPGPLYDALQSTYGGQKR